MIHALMIGGAIRLVITGMLLPQSGGRSMESDTIITRTVQVRDLLDWTGGVLELVVLLLGAGVLAALLWLLLAARRALLRVTAAAEQLADDTRPILQEASATVAEARAMARTIREDVGKVSGAAGAMGDQLLEATEATAQRVRDVGAVLDVVQDELEETALASARALRGLRLGGLAPRDRRRRDQPRSASGPATDDSPAHQSDDRPARNSGAES